MTDIIVSSGQTLTDPMLQRLDQLTILNGGTVISGLAVGADVTVSGGGHLRSFTLGSGAYLKTAGKTLDVLVQSGGTEEISSGGRDTGATIQAGGFVSVDIGGVSVSATLMTSGYAGVAGVISAAQVRAGTVNVMGQGSSVAVSDHDLVMGTGSETLGQQAIGYATMVTAGGRDFVHGGMLSGGVIAAGGTLIVGAEFTSQGQGGIARGTMVGSGGVLVVLPSGTAEATQAAAGSLVVLIDGAIDQGLVAAQGATVLSSGVVTIRAGGVFTRATTGQTVNGAAGDGQYVLDHGRASATSVISGGHQDVYSGGLARGTTVSGAPGVSPYDPDQTEQFVHSGGVALGTVLTAGGQLDMTGGFASGTMVGSGGRVFEEGGRLAGASVMSGSVTILGGIATNMILVDGTLEVEGGDDPVVTSIHDTVETDSVIDIYEASSFDLLMNGGRLFVDAMQDGSDTALAQATTLTNGALVTVQFAGQVNDTVVESSGKLVLNLAGEANHTRLLQGGTLELTSLTFHAGTTATLNTATDVLTIQSGDKTASVSLAGSYAGEHFTLTADGRGTDITVSSDASRTAAALGREIGSAGMAAVLRDLVPATVSAGGLAAADPAPGVIGGGGRLLAAPDLHPMHGLHIR